MNRTLLATTELEKVLIKRQEKRNVSMAILIYKLRKQHKVYGAVKGIVIKAARSPDYGNFVEIKHGRKLVAKYAQLKETQVKEGNKIKRGQFIGIQGRTGNATGKHLHFEILLDSQAINPFDFIFNYCKCKL